MLHVKEDEVDIVVCRESNGVRARVDRDAEGDLVLVEQPDEAGPGHRLRILLSVHEERGRRRAEDRDECKPRENGSHRFAPGSFRSSRYNAGFVVRLQLDTERRKFAKVIILHTLFASAPRRPIRFSSTTACRKSSRLGDCRATPSTVRFGPNPTDQATHRLDGTRAGVGA